MDEAFGFAPPPFKPDDALAGLKRSLRELGLAERAGVWERRGTAVAKAAIEADAIAVAMVKKPSRNSPQWQRRMLRNSPEVREYLAELKRKLAGWSDSDD